MTDVKQEIKVISENGANIFTSKSNRVALHKGKSIQPTVPKQPGSKTSEIEKSRFTSSSNYQYHPQEPTNRVNLTGSDTRQVKQKSSLTNEGSIEAETSLSCEDGYSRNINLKGSQKTESKKNGSKKSLRKGKWTTEEEEYTEKVIQHFSSGLLTLPEGMTLRSYLAEKLNCDPMRITKKFAGSSCLGKRINRAGANKTSATATATDAEMAFKELAYYETRFRLRVEAGFPGIHLDPSSSSAFHDNTAILNAQLQANLLHNRNNMSIIPGALAGASLFTASAGVPTYPTISSQINPFVPTSIDPQKQLDVNLKLQLQQQFQIPMMGVNVNTSRDSMNNFFKMIQGKDLSSASAKVSLEWAQRNMSPALLQESLRRMNFANFQSQMLFPQATGFQAIPQNPLLAENLFQQYQSHPQDQIQINQSHTVKKIDSLKQNSNKKMQSLPKDPDLNSQVPSLLSTSSAESSKAHLQKPSERTKEENDSATMLLGFLNSLRQNHKAALEKANELDAEVQRKQELKIRSSASGSEKEQKALPGFNRNLIFSNESNCQSSRQEKESLSTLTHNPSDFSSSSSKGSSDAGKIQHQNKSREVTIKQRVDDGSGTKKHSTTSQQPGSVSTLTSNPSDFSSTSSKGSSNDGDFRKQLQPTIDLSKRERISGEPIEKTLDTSRTITFKNKLRHDRMNGKRIPINGSSTSESSGGYYDDTDRPSTLTSSEGTKTDNSSSSNDASSEDDSDKDSSDKKIDETRSKKRRTSFTSSTWPYRNFN